MHVVIFAGGTVRAGQAVTAALAQASMVIAADSGAATALEYGYIPDLIVGDFDSLSEEDYACIAPASRVVRAPAEKDETDTELAVRQALEHGASEITLLGALGGMRFEHTVANLLLLADVPVPIRIIDGPTTCWLLRGPACSRIAGRKDDLLSLFPLTADATGISTHGLYYALHNATLHFGSPRGISNVLTQDEAEISLGNGLLLLIHTSRAELEEA